MTRDLEAEIGTIYAENEAVMEILNGTITEGENYELYQAFLAEYGTFVNLFTTAIQAYYFWRWYYFKTQPSFRRRTYCAFFQYYYRKR